MELQVKGAQLSYEVTGSGPALVLLHGRGDNQAAWWGQVPAFAQHYQVVTSDVRGHGRTRVRGEDYSYEACVEDLYALLQALKISRAALLGYSLGGEIIAHFALRSPEAVTALVLSNCAGMVFWDRVSWQGWREHLRREIDALEHGGMDGTFPQRVSEIFSSGFPERNPEVVERYRAVYTANSAQEYLKRMRLSPVRPPTPDLGRISCPTLIIVGEHDASNGPEAGKAMQQAIRGSQLRVFPTGHATALEMPQEYNAAVLEFLAGVTE